MQVVEITSSIVKELKLIVGDQYVMTDDDSRKDYGHDQTEDLQFYPSVVIKPRTAEEIAAIMKIANRDLIPVHHAEPVQD